MNPTYARIRLPLTEAMMRFRLRVNPQELEPPVALSSAEAIARAVDDEGLWRGAAKFVYENDGWTVFEDLSGHLGGLSTETWLAFAGRRDFVFAGYNSAIKYGEFLQLGDGMVIREFLYDGAHPEDHTDRGMSALLAPQSTWIEVARFVDDDELAFSELGLLWMH